MNIFQEIQSVKLNGTGYLLNGNVFIPKVDGNEKYELIKQWLEDGNIPEAEFTDEELAKQELQSKIIAANNYLKDTDWVNAYKLRNDLGLEAIPEDSSKWEIIYKRTKYIEFLKDNQ